MKFSVQLVVKACVNDYTGIVYSIGWPLDGNNAHACMYMDEKQCDYWKYPMRRKTYINSSNRIGLSRAEWPNADQRDANGI